jgi:hypothetical protein
MNMRTQSLFVSSTDHLAVPFAKRPTNAEGSGGFFVNTFQILFPDMFRFTVAILRGS